MLVFIYIVLTVAVGASALFKRAIYAGVAGIIGSMLCWFAASGMRGSLMVGSRSQILAGSVVALFFVAIGIAIVYHSGFWVGFFGYEFSGVIWCLIGLIGGWVSTTREHAEGPSKRLPADAGRREG